MRTIDIIALIVSVIVAIAITIRTVSTSHFSLRPVAAFLALFGPSTILVHMSFQVGQVNFNAIEKINQASFKYDFQYYSLMLMAIAIAYCAVLVLQHVRRFFEGGNYRGILKAMAITVLVSVPTIPFTPIGSLSTLACLITLCALPFVKKRGKLVVVKKYPRAAKSTESRLETISVLKFV